MIDSISIRRLLCGMDRHDSITPQIIAQKVQKYDKHKLAEYFFGINAMEEYDLDDDQHLELIGRMLCLLPLEDYHQSKRMIYYLIEQNVYLESMNLPAEHQLYLMWMVGSDITE